MQPLLPQVTHRGARPNVVIQKGLMPVVDQPAQHLIRQLTTADILEDTIRRIFIDDSVSEIFAGENQLF